MSKTSLITILLLTPAALAETIVVTSTADDTGGPDCTLRDAITAANTDNAVGGCVAGNGNDTIELPAGGTVDLLEALDLLNSDMTINGNGATVQRSAVAGASFRILSVTTGGNVEVNDITIANGHVSSAGAGVSNAGTMTMNGCIIRDNIADGVLFPGGGLYNVGTMTLSNCQILNNTTLDGDGGGIGNDGQLFMDGCLVRDNSAPGFVDEGGGLFTSGPATVTNSEFIDNESDRDGGAVFVDANTSTFADCTFTGNTTDIDASAIHVDNTATLILSRCTVMDNSDDIDDRAICNEGQLDMTNCTVTGNMGDGIVSESGDATIIHCTVTDNGVLGIRGSFTDIVTVSHSIVSGNVFGDCDDDVIDGGYNIIADGDCTSAPTTVTDDPLLEPAQDNGGPTPTRAPGDDSPAIDAVPIAQCSESTDQRGIPRPQGAGCDIGAVEYACGSEPPLCGNCMVDPGEDCDGGSCCNADCTFKVAGTECRASQDLCDAAETCTGDSAACPVDAVAGTDVPCSPPMDACPIFCDGINPSCPDLDPCDDSDPCTVDSCIEGVGCENLDINGQPCVTSADCLPAEGVACVMNECLCPAVTRAYMDRAGSAGLNQPVAGPMTITMLPGTTEQIEVWLNASDAQDSDTMAGYQLIFQPDAQPQPGATGTVTYVDNDPGGPAGDSILIDTTRPEWVYVDSIAISPNFQYAEQPTFFAAIYGTAIPADNVQPFESPQPMYLAEFQIAASADACGEHLVVWNTQFTGEPPFAALFAPG